MAQKNCVAWDIVHEVTSTCDWDERAIERTIQLFEEDNTIPFIARYRQHVTKGMGPEKLREVKKVYEEKKTVKEKIEKVLRDAKLADKLTERMRHDLRWAKTPTEVEHLCAPLKTGARNSLSERTRQLGLEQLAAECAPLKTGAKNSLAERARQLGLEQLAAEVIDQPHRLPPDAILKAVNPKQAGLQTVAEVSKGVQHLIADHVSKHQSTLTYVRQLAGAGTGRYGDILIEVNPAKKSDQPAKAKAKTQKGKPEKSHPSKRAYSVEKFADYLGKTFSIRTVKPHQVLAINRGESLKLLSVKLHLSAQERNSFKSTLHRRWLTHQHSNAPGNHYLQLMQESLEDSFKRLIEPLTLRQARSELNKRVEESSIDVFASNLKRLLLTPPVRGRCVLGVDPGFQHGCKFALTSPTGTVLDHGVAYLHTHSANVNMEKNKIREVLLKHKCGTVAIGNGMACRETETFFSTYISQGAFKPLDVHYCIVDESGASIYSASPEAEEELKEYDVTIRGAVSIARRLQDPLAELVKIEPKHIGVGMYQHDCSESGLRDSLDSVVMECVSFTGVDLNTASHTLLRKIAGLDAGTAKRIVDMRTERGAFINRKQLLSVKGVGPARFQQCAGFVRILPTTTHTAAVKSDLSEVKIEVKVGSKHKTATTGPGAAKRKKVAMETPEIDEFDRTAIHPETYSLAESIVQEMGVQKADIGTRPFADAVEGYRARECNVNKLSEKLEADATTVSFILDCLQKPVDWDLRQDFAKPLFRREAVKMSELTSGMRLTGKVQNVVHFGAFVDIGVGNSGLLHSSKIHRHLLKNGGRELGVGDMVEVEVERVEVDKQRISLTLVRLL